MDTTETKWLKAKLIETAATVLDPAYHGGRALSVLETAKTWFEWVGGPDEQPANQPAKRPVGRPPKGT